MEKLKLGAWIVANIVAAYNLGMLTFVGCWLYYFEERLPPGEGGIHQIHLTQIDVAITIFNASICSALFATCMAGLGFYIHHILWKYSINKNKSKRWGWWIFIINWIIIFFPAIIMSYRFFVQRSVYF